MIRAATWLVAALSCVAGVAMFTIATPARASAATAYRYWAYYLGQGSTWQYAQRGPASEHPVDGDVEGWRFAIQTDAAGGLTPRDVPDFATLCAATPAKAGEIRVGLVIDFGVASDAPAHESPPAGVVPGCVYVHAGDNGSAVLQAATTVRIGTGVDAGLVCGIDSYPKTECAVAVAVIPSSTATPSSRPTTTPTAARTPTSTATASTIRPTPSSAPPPPAAATAATVGSASSAQPAIGGTPASGGTSGSDVAAPSSPETSFAVLKTSHSGSGSGVVAAVLGGVLVVVLGAAAIVRSRRGRP